MSTPLVVAHRGDPVTATENTLPALRRAVADGAQLVEIDVRRTADGEVVLLHDATTERIWGAPRPVAEQTLADLRSLALEDGTGVPTLAEALRAVSPSALLVDLTDAATAIAAWEVVQEVRGAHDTAAPRTDVPAPAWCGVLAGLEAVRERDAAAEIWLTWDGPELPPAEVTERLAPYSWNPEHVHVTAGALAAARERGLATTCWTVDDPERAAELTALGVAGIISNRAAAVRTRVQEDAR